MIDKRSDETRLKCHKCFNSIYAKLKSLVQFRRMVFSSQGNTKHVSVTSNTKGPGCLEANSNNRVIESGKLSSQLFRCQTDNGVAATFCDRRISVYITLNAYKSICIHTHIDTRAA